MHRLPKGKYFIGDPSLVLTPSKWDKMCDDCENFQDDEILTFEGHEIWILATDSDGTMMDQNGNEYEWRSGFLGAVPIELIDNPEGEEHGTMLDVTVERGLNVEYAKGAFYFGNICINTNEDEEYGSAYDDNGEDDYFV